MYLIEFQQMSTEWRGGGVIAMATTVNPVLVLLYGKQCNHVELFLAKWPPLEVCRCMFVYMYMYIHVYTRKITYIHVHVEHHNVHKKEMET